MRGFGQFVQLLLRTPDLLLVAPALGDIPQNHDGVLGAVQLYLGYRGFDREFLSVGTYAGEQEVLPRRAHGGTGVVNLDHAPLLPRLETAGNETADVGADRLCARAAEYPLRRCVEQQDALFPVQSDDGVHGGLDDGMQPLLRLDYHRLQFLIQVQLVREPQRDYREKCRDHRGNRAQQQRSPLPRCQDEIRRCGRRDDQRVVF